MRNLLTDTIGVFVFALAFGLYGEAQAPTEESVPSGTVKDGRVTLPTGGQFAAPDPTWEWRVLRVGEVKTFVLAKIGDSARIFVMHQRGAHVTDEFMRGFVDGTLRRSTKQGIQVKEPTFIRSDFPVPGSYRFDAATTLPNGVQFARVGYVLPSGHIVMTSFQGPSEPAALKAVAASFKESTPAE